VFSVLVAYQQRDVADGVRAGLDQSSCLFQSAGLDVGVRRLPGIVAEVAQEGRGARERVACNRGQRDVREEIGFNVAHRSPGHGIHGGRAGPSGAFPLPCVAARISTRSCRSKNASVLALSRREITRAKTYSWASCFSV